MQIDCAWSLRLVQQEPDFQKGDTTAGLSADWWAEWHRREEVRQFFEDVAAERPQTEPPLVE